MDYDDINKIAEMLTDDVKPNNGLANGLSINPTSPPSHPSYDDEMIRIRYSSPNQKRTIKSITLLEMDGYHCIAAKQQEFHNCHVRKPVVPPPPPSPVPRPTPSAILKRTRVLEL